MQFEWKLTYIWEVETVGQNWLQKRTFVLEEVSDKEWKQSLAIDLIKDRVWALDKFNVGDVVIADLNLKTNYSDKLGRYYNSVNAWKVGLVSKNSFESTDCDTPF